MTILLHVLVAALYAATAWARWPRSVPASAERRRVGEALLVLALALHGVAAWQAIVRPGGLDLSLRLCFFQSVASSSLVFGGALVLLGHLGGVRRGDAGRCAQR